MALARHLKTLIALTNMERAALSPLSLVRTLVAKRSLIWQLTQREALARYRGSLFGVAWAVLTPLALLAVYTFVFTEVFNARWGNQTGGSKMEFAIALFCGLTVFNVFGDSVARAPQLIVANANYVKKLVFPLEILPLVNVLAGLFHFCISFMLLLVFELLVYGFIPWTALWMPVVLLPLALCTLGLNWVLASLGVYLRDVGQSIGLLVTGLMFMSPLFFPLSAMPAAWRPLLALNPLALPIEQARAVAVFGQAPNAEWLLIATPISVLIAWLGYAWFQATRRGFADVL